MSLKRTGFARKVYERAPASAPRPLVRAVSYAGHTGPAQVRPKAHRNAHLLTLARDQSCLLRVPGVCRGDTATTVACHSNWQEHGKAGARKADDFWSVHGCAACHQWLDQGPATHQEKRVIFDAAMVWMIDIWSEMALDPYGQDDSTPKDRAAAQWALERIEEWKAR